MVSIIIPAFNSEKYIFEAVKSVFNQTYLDYELIIVNDGSTDNTETILEPFEDRIIYIYQENKGAAAARNTGVMASKGEYIAFLDSDDIWFPTKLGLQINYFNQHADVGLVYADYGLFDDKGILFDNYPLANKFPRPSGYIFNDLLMTCFISTITVMAKRDVIISAGLFDDRFLIGEDYDLWLNISAKNKVGYLPEVVSMCRQHASSLHVSGPEGVTPWEIQVVEKALSEFPEKAKNIPTNKLRQRFAGPYFQVGLEMVQKLDISLARSLFRKSVTLWPFNIKAILYFIITHTPFINKILIYFFKKLT